MRRTVVSTIAAAAALGLLSTGSFAADVARPVVVQPQAAVVAPVHPLLHPILWCAGGVIISVVVHNWIPAAVGCTIGGVELVHNHHAVY